MSDFLKRIAQLSPQRLALLAAELQSKLENAEREKSAPIAVVGMSCRFPGGANNPEAYWEMLRAGVDAVTEVPASRWDIDAYYDPDLDAPGKMNTRWGGFLADVDQFDPQFFGISPREAMSMDPQQRFLLEVAWEALERAGYAPDSLTGSLTGVFIGMCNNDYGNMMLGGDLDQIDLYLATGGASSVASGRLSYVLGLQGPSISIDTACSSSLVSVHLAIQALRTGDCDLALAGGVNMTLMPETTITLSKAKMMAPDGHCKAFDSRADGFVRGEGCGIIVLKRLSDAVAAGDHILAVIRGSAVNQDGRSNGLTAPNGPSQAAVIRAALADARLEPKDISYIETHGTGTSLGDPIEVQALGASLGSGHSHESPLMIGSVKTNLGHLELAAGIAGLIKLILMVQHAEIPPHLHLIEPNPYIPWADLPVAIPDGLIEWSPESGKRIGGTSSFGFSGTNAHIIVEPPPRRRRSESENERPLHILTLSGRDRNALDETVDRFVHHLADHTADSIGDVCFTANSGRSHQSHRLAVVGVDIANLREVLAVYQSGQQPDNLFVGQAQREKRIAFLFTGQGAQYVAMGQELYQTQAKFREVIDLCDELLLPLLDRSLLSILYPEPGEESAIHDIAYAQPAQFAVQYALAKLWESWGITPSIVVGHSIGEYAAACVAGVFSLEDGLKLVTARSRLMSQTASGEMASVFTTPEHVAQVIAPYGNRVAIAAVNGPEMVVISGENEAVAAVIDDLKAEKIRARRLEVSIAGHSPLMQPILDAFATVAAEVTYASPQVEFISGLTGDFIEGHELTHADYWRRHLRETVQFSAAIQTLGAAGCEMFLEIGPAPTLISLGQRILSHDALWLPSLREGHGDWQTMLKSLGALYARGIDVDWVGFDRDYQRSRIVLPTYPFQRASYWIQRSQTVRAKPRDTADNIHPLLGRPLKSPAIKDVVFESQLSATWPSFLHHHRIFGVVILPSPAYLEMALRAATTHFKSSTYRVENFAIRKALILPEDGLRTLQFVMTPEGQGTAAFQVVSLDGDDWTVHATGNLRPGAAPSHSNFDIGEIQTRCTEMVDGADYYQQVRELGLEFGSNFRGIRELWRRDGEALGRVELPDELVAQVSQYAIHPAFLDACFHLLGAPLPADGLEAAYLLIGMDSFQLYQTPGKVLWNHTVLTEDMNGETFSGNCYLYDEIGTLIAEARGLNLKRAGRDALMWATRQRQDDLFYQVVWNTKSNARQFNNLPTPDQIAAEVAPVIDASVAAFPIGIYSDVSTALDDLSLGYMLAAFFNLGWKMKFGEKVTAETLSQQLGIVVRYRPLIGRLLIILSEAGFLAPTSTGEFEVVNTPVNDDVGSDTDALAAHFADYAPIIEILKRCGSSLSDVLRGEIDPLHLLFPDGSFDETEALYHDIPTAALYNSLVREVLGTMLANTNGHIRVLEIGAGTGGTTSFVLPVMPADSTEYVFTDLSPLFLERAQEKFSTYPFVRYQLLDIEQNPETQGLAGQQFDVIVAANVLHATADLSQTLANIRHLLSPNGRLVLIEGTQPQRWVDLTFGLTEGWWRFQDVSLRPDYPLLSQSGWATLLHDQRFNEIALLPQVADDNPLAGQVIIIAGGLPVEQPAITTGNWLIFADAAGVGEALASEFAPYGATCLFVRPGEQFVKQDEVHWQIHPDASEQYQELLSSADEWSGVIYLWGLDQAHDELQAGDEVDTSNVLLLTQALIQHHTAIPLWLVTENGQPVETGCHQYRWLTLVGIWPGACP